MRMDYAVDPGSARRSLVDLTWGPSRYTHKYVCQEGQGAGGSRSQVALDHRTGAQEIRAFISAYLACSAYSCLLSCFVVWHLRYPSLFLYGVPLVVPQLDAALFPYYQFILFARILAHLPRVQPN